MNAAERKRDEYIRSLDAQQLLSKLLSDDEITDVERSAFDDMNRQARSLTPAQRKWAEDVMRRITPLDASLVPRGREVETPDVLKKLPLHPPNRRSR